MIDYGALGGMVQRKSQAILETNLEAIPDFTKIANEAIKGRSEERKAATRAKAQVARQGLSSQATVETYKIKADTKKLLPNRSPAKRMAEFVGAAGTLAGACVMKQGNDKAEKRHQERMDALAKSRKQLLLLLGHTNPKNLLNKGLLSRILSLLLRLVLLPVPLVLPLPELSSERGETYDLHETTNG